MQPWQQTLREYLGAAPVVDDPGDRFGTMVAAMDWLRAVAATSASWPRIDLQARPDLEIRARDTVLLAFERRTGEVMGGVGGPVPIVLPEHRGRGICAELHLLADGRGERSFSAAYTESGFKARKRAHMLHLERAFAAGVPVPGRVLSDYARDAEGRLSLRLPYGRSEHEAWIAAMRAERIRERHARETIGMTAVLQDADELHAREFVEFAPNDAGRGLALALNEDIGARIRLTTCRSLRLAQAQVGEMVIDVYGIRPAARATEELRRRGSRAVHIFMDRC
ncbi:hypothetical protein LAZ40_09690 [Cereibacter sphaeroides]|uniref:hypothetical protein n=1 Tax=Cereibacter sphaeroides TaxID=1063 RepID=UPI001F3B47FF|nr:hypothetical protein [Cereibacter sphaeroides]MCE6959322.1 hypothetical protein [Cereibacter sphaeroides]MCE6972914.1 hypothetical protein [Cereibacter sphaeroides]